MFTLLLCLFWIGKATCFDSSSYTNSIVMAPLDYTVYWRADVDNNTIYLALKVKTTGWVGFGIAEPTSGSMPGADIMVGYVQNGINGSIATVEDRWSYAHVMPVKDDCQDVDIVAGEEVDGYTIVEVKRPINSTSHTQDRSIAYGPNRVIVSHSDDGTDELSYHGPNKVTGEITFFGEALYSSTPVPGEQTIDLRMSDFAIPDQETTYACQAFALPLDKNYTITQIAPIINPDSLRHVHHFVAHVCYNYSLDPRVTSVVQTYQKPAQCPSPLGNPVQGCVGIVAAWASGGGPTYTPEEAGFAMGPMPNSVQFIVLEIHYNGGGVVDNSGIRLHYSTTPRRYEAGVMIAGDVFVTLPSIPAYSPAFEVETECPSTCLSKISHDIQIFASFPHMHKAGTQMWTTQWRDGEMIDQIGRIEYWAYNHQLTQPINKTVKIGDRLNTHCVYNNANSPSSIEFGTSSSEEMCMHFLSYYPRLYTTVQGERLPVGFCGYLENNTVCGSAFNYYQIPNPSDRDPTGGAQKTFGVADNRCQATSVPTSPSTVSPTARPTSDGARLAFPVLSLVSLIWVTLFS